MTGFTSFAFRATDFLLVAVAACRSMSMNISATSPVQCHSYRSLVASATTTPSAHIRMEASFVPSQQSAAASAFAGLPIRSMTATQRCGYRLPDRRRRLVVVFTMEQFSPDNFEMGSMLGTFGYMNISSYGPGSSYGSGLLENAAAGLDERDVGRLSGQEVGQGNVQIRLYAGRILRGQRMGTRVLLKAYPGMVRRGADADVMAVNELATHAALQSEAGLCRHLVYLYGGFQTRTGEQWLVFRDDGRLTAADYAKAASEATSGQRAVGDWDFWDRFDPSRPIQRRRFFVIQLLRGVFIGLANMHSQGRLHQSLGPASVVLNTMEERDVRYLVPRLRDLAFSADVSDKAIFSGLLERRVGSPKSDDGSLETATAALSEDLWRRAVAAGATTAFEKRAFGISDDIYAGGLLMAYMVFVPFSAPGSIDGPSLQRLLETTFRLDIQAAREYLAADDRLTEAVKFLDLDDGAGWQLLQAMLNPDYRQRPTAEAVVNHAFMTGAVLE